MDELDRFRTFRHPVRDVDGEAERRARALLRDRIATPRRGGPLRRLYANPRMTLAGGIGAAAVIAAVVTALVLPTGGGPGVVARARAALTPGDSILHVMTVNESIVNGQPGPGPEIVEQWFQTEAPFAARTAIRLEQNGPAHELESVGLTDYRWGYDEATDTLRQVVREPSPVAADEAAVTRGVLAGLPGLQSAKNLLDRGIVTLAGETTVAGTAAYKLASTDGANVLYVDRATYLPLVEETATILPTGERAVLRRTRLAVERLAPTPENLALTSLRAQHPDAQIGLPTDDPDVAQGWPNRCNGPAAPTCEAVPNP